MAASYPSLLPTKDAAGANLSTNPHSALHDDVYDEVVAMATELGTNPKGTSASVKARLDAMDKGWSPIDSGSLAATSLTVSFPASKYSALRLRMRGSVGSSTLITARLNSVSTSTYQYSLIESRGDTGAVATATANGGAGLWVVGAWLTAANSLELTVLNTHLNGRQGFHSQSMAMSATTSAMRLARGGGARTADLLPTSLNILNNATTTITAEWELEGYVR